MSNPASNAAAIAAFRASQKKDEDVSRYNPIPKPKLRQIQTKRTVKASAPSGPKPGQNSSVRLPNYPAVRSNPNAATTTDEYSKYVYSPSQISYTDAYSNRPNSPLTPAVNGPPQISPQTSMKNTNSIQSSNVYTPTLVSSRTDNSAPSIHSTKSGNSLPGSTATRNRNSTSLPRDMINQVKQSIEAKSTPKDQSSRRISAHYEPQEMIKNMKLSINSKSKPIPINDPQKSNHMINQIRNSIDLKRISTPVIRTRNSPELHSPLMLPQNTSNDELLKSPFLRQTNSSSEDFVAALNDKDNANSYTINSNRSHSSLGSNILENEYQNSSKTPTIVLSHSLPLVEAPGGVRSSPIAIPPSPNAYARLAETHSVESFSLGNRKDDLFGTPITPDDRTKPRRKPPPMDSYSLSVDLYGVDRNVDVISSRSLITATDYDTDFDDLKSSTSSTKGVFKNEMTEFPQFPDIKVGAERIGSSFFRTPAVGSKQKGVDSTVNLLDLDEDSDIGNKTDSLMTSESAAANAIITHVSQPIKLKKTMRKTNTRKERKLKFNDNKPWKNHRDLNYLSEPERKRYEGLWVSNKGHYIDSVVTKLAGVNYHDLTEGKLNEEEETSLKAARLSTRAMGNYDDKENLHNLKSASIDQLIHAVVVKRIWKRSRLPNETLQSVWNLVDFRKDGTLNKAEFLVGMWLIDQCLYGRKLPKKVDDIVWDNLGSIGVNVVIKRKGRR